MTIFRWSVPTLWNCLPKIFILNAELNIEKFYPNRGDTNCIHLFLCYLYVKHVLTKEKNFFLLKKKPPLLCWAHRLTKVARSKVTMGLIDTIPFHTLYLHIFKQINWRWRKSHNRKWLFAHWIFQKYFENGWFHSLIFHYENKRRSIFNAKKKTAVKIMHKRKRHYIHT